MMMETLGAKSSLVVTGPRPPAVEPITVWGLSVRELHDAYWRSRGVQCVRRGEGGVLDRATEQYLLLERDQLVWFDLASLSERLTWHNPLVTRLRIVDEHARRYSEHVVVNDEGLVQRIERRYRPALRGSSRVMLTLRRRTARVWAAAADRREGWKRVRRSVPWARVDHGRCAGLLAVDGVREQESELLDALVQRWPTPSQAIDGIEELEPGVWQVMGEAAGARGVSIGPVWLGLGAWAEAGACLIGPRWLADGPGPSAGGRAVVRRAGDVEYVAGSPRVEACRPGLPYALVKRGLDLVLSGAALAASAPVMVMVALLIKLEDGGPIFFGHRRQGRGGRAFRCWKFRTMHANAEEMAREFEEYNVCDGPQVFIQDDPRVTRIGRFLRRAHLDELPQFFNVLLGQMSIVGPRPSPDDENRYCPAWRDARLSVRPGITGLWQLKRRREAGEDFQEWIRYDIEYVQRASLLFDLEIMAKTAWIMVMGRGDHEDE